MSLLVSALMVLVLSAADPEPGVIDVPAVKNLGDPKLFVFEGVTSYAPETIRHALNSDLEFLKASRPEQPLSEFLKIIEQGLRTGYRRCGFANARIEARHDRSRGRVVIRIDEGQRFRCGEVQVTGVDKVLENQLIDRLTQPHPSTYAVEIVRTDVQGRQTSCWFDQDGAQAKWVAPVWKPGADAPQDLQDYDLKTIERLFAWHGYFFPKYEVTVQPGAAAGTSNLVIAVSALGPTGEIADIDVQGAEQNTQGEILEYLRVQPGLACTARTEAELTRRLWESGRFVKQDVTLSPATKTPGRLTLKILVEELRVAPTLVQPLERNAAALVRMMQWLGNGAVTGNDLTATFHSDEMKLHVETAFSNRNGLLVDGERTSARGGIPFDLSYRLTPDSIGAYSAAANSKYEVPKLGVQARASFEIRVANPKDSKDRPSNWMAGNGWRYPPCPTGTGVISPIVVELECPPAAGIQLAGKRNMQFEWQGNVLIARYQKPPKPVPAASAHARDESGGRMPPEGWKDIHDVAHWFTANADRAIEKLARSLRQAGFDELANLIRPVRSIEQPKPPVRAVLAEFDSPPAVPESRVDVIRHLREQGLNDIADRIERDAKSVKSNPHELDGVSIFNLRETGVKKPAISDEEFKENAPDELVRELRRNGLNEIAHRIEVRTARERALRAGNGRSDPSTATNDASDSPQGLIEKNRHQQTTSAVEYLKQASEQKDSDQEFDRASAELIRMYRKSGDHKNADQINQTRVLFGLKPIPKETEADKSDEIDDQFVLKINADTGELLEFCMGDVAKGEYLLVRFENGAFDRAQARALKRAMACQNRYAATTPVTGLVEFAGDICTVLANEYAVPDMRHTASLLLKLAQGHATEPLDKLVTGPLAATMAPAPNFIAWKYAGLTSLLQPALPILAEIVPGDSNLWALTRDVSLYFLEPTDPANARALLALAKSDQLGPLAQGALAPMLMAIRPGSGVEQAGFEPRPKADFMQDLSPFLRRDCLLGQLTIACANALEQLTDDELDVIAELVPESTSRGLFMQVAKGLRQPSPMPIEQRLSNTVQSLVAPLFGSDAEPNSSDER